MGTFDESKINRNRGRFADKETPEGEFDFGGTHPHLMSDGELADMHHEDDPDRDIATWADTPSTDAPF